MELDVCFLEISILTVSITDKHIDQSIEFFPNPFKSNLTIQWDLNKHSTREVSIFNLHGQKIYSDQIFSGKEIDTSYLINGIYYFQIADSKGRKITKKLIKMRSSL